MTHRRFCVLATCGLVALAAFAAWSHLTRPPRPDALRTKTPDRARPPGGADRPGPTVTGEPPGRVEPPAPTGADQNIHEQAAPLSPRPRGTVRLVDRRSGRVIDGAIAASVEMSGRVLDGSKARNILGTSGPDGLLSLPVSGSAPVPTGISALRRRVARGKRYVFYSPLHAPLVASVVRSRDSVDEPIELRLGRAAVLRGEVTFDPNIQSDGAHVRLLTELPRLTPSKVWNDRAEVIQWEAPIDADGTFVLSGLPGETPMVASIVRAGERLWSLPNGILLKDGEERSVTWHVVARPTVVVRAREVSGDPAVGVELALERSLARMRSRGPDPSQKVYWASDPNSTRRMVTDQSGTVVFESVEEAQRWVTVVANDAMDPSDAPAPTITRFVVDPDVLVVEVDVTVYRGAYIEGAVMTAKGEPLRAMVRASSTERGQMLSDGPAKSRFRIGPLIPGEYDVGAVFVQSERFAPGPAVRTRTGTLDVVIPAVRSSEVHGFVTGIDAKRIRDCGISIQRVGRLGNDGQMVGVDGSFSFEGLGVGPFALTVHLEANIVARAMGEVLREGSVVADLRIDVSEPTAVVCTQSTEHARLLMIAKSKQLEVDRVWLEKFEGTRMFAPPGDLELLFFVSTDDGASLRHVGTRDVHVVEGEALPVHFE